MDEEKKQPVYGRTKILIKKRKLLPTPLPFTKGKGLKYYFTNDDKIDFEVCFEFQFEIEEGVINFIYDYTFKIKRLNKFHLPPVYDERIIATIFSICKQVWKDAEKINGLYHPDYMDYYTDDESKIEDWQEWETVDGIPTNLYYSCDFLDGHE
jgi:hypothetical protein